MFYKIRSVLDDNRFPILAKGRSSFHSCPRQLLFLSIYFHQNFQFHPLPTKRICVQLRYCVLMMLSQWSFSSQSRLDFFLQIAAVFPALSVLMISLDKHQTKTFEDLNISIIVLYLEKYQITVLTVQKFVANNLL